ncbi:hypothetical protein GKZ68_14335 [Hymenobacter sp. BRD128]|uniref:hypothetical protein n=1 Tax=Hymenobacter sp. BRD128 TaxID=2675878 RepID=UPI0015662F22|nr:hypothetical protein [Hymenobacter sp. BRD128]QKG57703.1 hypothetical protein GKZ68_14335 [Hymenobacter sp. BRD128]
MINILILSYGNILEYNRAIFMMLSFECYYSGNKQKIRFVIFTDNADLFKSYNFESDLDIIPISKSEIVQLKGPANFIHIVKIAIVEKTFNKYPQDYLLFIDSDTFFIQDPIKLFEEAVKGKIFMHVKEYLLEDAIELYRYVFNSDNLPKSFLNLIENKSYILDNKNVNFNRHHYSWNSGVLGLTPEMARIIPDIYNMANDFYQSTEWILSEQLAFSLALQVTVELNECGQFITHYYEQKEFVDEFLEKNLTSDIKKIKGLDRKKQINKLVLNLRAGLKINKFQKESSYFFYKKQIWKGIYYASLSFRAKPFDIKYSKDILWHARKIFKEWIVSKK